MTFLFLFLGQHAVRTEKNNHAERVYSMPYLFRYHAAVRARQYFIASSDKMWMVLIGSCKSTQTFCLIQTTVCMCFK